MKKLLALADKSAISLSMLCAVHCLLMPLLIVLLPALAGLPIAEESFHLWMVVAVIPLSLYALTVGCKKHKSKQVMIIGGIGLFTLVATAIFGHDFLGEMGEKVFTVLGAAIIAYGHFRNFKLCQQQDACEMESCS